MKMLDSEHLISELNEYYYKHGGYDGWIDLERAAGIKAGTISNMAHEIKEIDEQTWKLLHETAPDEIPSVKFIIIDTDFDDLVDLEPREFWRFFRSYMDYINSSEQMSGWFQVEFEIHFGDSFRRWIKRKE